MADTFRYRYGAVNPIQCAVDSATVIEIGDLVYLDVNDAKPASSQADGGTEPINQRAFAAKFLGVAMQRSRSGDTDAIRVATTGVFQFDSASATYEVGSLIGVDEASGGTALEDQKLAAVAAADLAIGVVEKAEASATTILLVRLESTLISNQGYRNGIIAAVSETLTATAPAISVHCYYTTLNDTSNAVAATLGPGLWRGQLKKIQSIADANTSVTVTCAGGFDGTNNTLTMADDGDFAILCWTGALWMPIELGNDIDGITAPALSAV
jgi:hypothetical protein